MWGGVFILILTASKGEFAVWVNVGGSVFMMQ